MFDIQRRVSPHPRLQPRRPRRGVSQQGRRAGGQSMVEFGLVLPIMLVLLIGVADLGRVFAAGVVIEAAARNAAETAASAYLSDPPGSGGLDAPVSGAASSEYDAIRTLAAATVCQEMRMLPNTAGSGSDCTGMPFIRVCVHDGADPGCASEAFGATIRSECPETGATMSNTQAGGYPQRWVEVRICYQFTSLLRAPLFSFGDIWLQRERSFVIPCYFVIGTAPCG
jgi:TadE-like protein